MDKNTPALENLSSYANVKSATIPLPEKHLLPIMSKNIPSSPMLQLANKPVQFACKY